MMLCIETSLSVNRRSKSSLQCLNCKLNKVVQLTNKGFVLVCKSASNEHQLSNFSLVESIEKSAIVSLLLMFFPALLHSALISSSSPQSRVELQADSIQQTEGAPHLEKRRSSVDHSLSLAGATPGSARPCWSMTRRESQEQPKREKDVVERKNAKRIRKTNRTPTKIQMVKGEKVGGQEQTKRGLRYKACLLWCVGINVDVDVQSFFFALSLAVHFFLYQTMPRWFMVKVYFFCFWTSYDVVCMRVFSRFFVDFTDECWPSWFAVLSDTGVHAKR